MAWSALKVKEEQQQEGTGAVVPTEQAEEKVPVRQDTKKRDHEEDQEEIGNGGSNSEAKRRRIDDEATVKEEEQQDVKMQVIKEEEEHKVDPERMAFEHGEDDDEPLYHGQRNSGKLVRRGNECPYLDTISRQNLDFDFEKCCSVSLSKVNVYVYALEKVIIPQVPIFDLLRKFDGETIQDDVRTGRRKMRITRLPKFLAIHVKRFLKNQFFKEKNPTIVNFPVKGLDLTKCISVPAPKATYDLIANIVHEGDANIGCFKAHIHRKSEDVWYEFQDLHLVDVLPQQVVLSEAYVQIYELTDM
eukprot:jgi/Picre1/35226/NNA_002688.t1